MCYQVKPEQGGFHKNCPACIDCSRAEVLEHRDMAASKDLARYQHLCLRCGKRQNRREFSLSSHQKHIRMVCHTCDLPDPESWEATLRGKLAKLVTSSRQTAKERVSKKYTRKFRKASVKAAVAMATLETEDLLEIYKQQGGRCAYSRIKLEISGDWRMSLERINERKGYIRTNVVLTCKEFNTFAQWSRAKFLIAQASIAKWNAPPPFKPVLVPPRAPKPVAVPRSSDAAHRFFSVAELAALNAARKAGLSNRQECFPFLKALAQDFSVRSPCTFEQVRAWANVRPPPVKADSKRKRARFADSSDEDEEDLPYRPLMQHTPIPVFTQSMRHRRPFSPEEVAILEKALADGADHHPTSQNIWIVHATAFSARAPCKPIQICRWFKRHRTKLDAAEKTTALSEADGQ
jgi:hypothetical protein